MRLGTRSCGVREKMPEAKTRKGICGVGAEVGQESIRKEKRKDLKKIKINKGKHECSLYVEARGSQVQQSRRPL